MKLEELNKLLNTLGYKVAYSHFNEATKPPFITYLVNGTDNFGADNKVYHKIKNVDIELYTDKKDLEAEKKIEDLLELNDFFWNSNEVYIESEKLYQVTYEITLI